MSDRRWVRLDPLPETPRTPTTEADPVKDAQVALVKAIWSCIVDASSMNVVMSGGEVTAAIRSFRAAIEAEARASLDVDRLREALERIANWKGNLYAGDAMAMKIRARAALTRNEPTP